MKLYPLQFTPLFKYRIWGGEKLKTELNKQYKEKNLRIMLSLRGIHLSPESLAIKKIL